MWPYADLCKVKTMNFWYNEAICDEGFYKSYRFHFGCFENGRKRPRMQQSRI